MTLATQEPETMQLPADTIWELTLPMADFRAVMFGVADKYENRPAYQCVQVEPDPDTGAPVLIAANGCLLFHLTLDIDKALAGELPQGGVAIPKDLLPAKGKAGNLIISQLNSDTLKVTYPDDSIKYANPPDGSYPSWRTLIPDPELIYSGRSTIGLGLYTMEPLVKAMKMLGCNIFKLHQHQMNGPLTLTIAGRKDFGGVIMPAYTQ